MDNQNNTANTEASNTGRKEWPQRWGTMTKLEIKSGRSGDYGIMTVQCGKFTQTAFVFKDTVLAKVQDAASKAHAAGVQASVWFKGPIEAVDRGGFSKDEMKVVYFKDNTDYASDDAPEADEGETAAPVEADDLTALKGVGETVAETLTAAGVTTFADLAAQTPESLEEMAKGYGARATRYDWIGQAAEKVAQASAATEAKQSLTDDIPF